jgi:hypothetical protein
MIKDSHNKPLDISKLLPHLEYMTHLDYMVTNPNLKHMKATTCIADLPSIHAPGPQERAWLGASTALQPKHRKGRHQEAVRYFKKKTDTWGRVQKIKKDVIFP